MSWRTKTALTCTSPVLLAQKMIEAGWKAMSDDDKQGLRTFFAKVLVHLDGKQRIELATRLSLPLPEDMPPTIPLLPFGKMPLLAKIRAKRIAARAAGRGKV